MGDLRPAKELKKRFEFQSYADLHTGKYYKDEIKDVEIAPEAPRKLLKKDLREIDPDFQEKNEIQTTSPEEMDSEETSQLMTDEEKDAQELLQAEKKKIEKTKSIPKEKSNK